MREWTLSAKVIAEFKINKKISWKRMNEICNKKTNSTCWVIQSLKRRWYNIKVIKSDDLLYVESYTLLSYKKPFYLIARDIEANHPKLENLVRFWYKLTK